MSPKHTLNLIQGRIQKVGRKENRRCLSEKVSVSTS
jgi:hypothetical protein